MKIARAATGRPAVITFDQAFHGRTLLTLSLTAKVNALQEGVRPVRARDLSRAVLVSVPRTRRAARHHRGDRVNIDAAHVACVVAEPIAGEGGFVVPEPGWLAGVANGVPTTACCSSPTRCRPASAGPATGLRATRGRGSRHRRDRRKASVPASRSGAHRAAPRSSTRVHVGGLGGTFGGNPVSCAAALASIDVIESRRTRRTRAACSATV